MTEALSQFNKLLNRKGAARVGYITTDGDNKPEAAVKGKKTPELLEEAIVTALSESLDAENLQIVSAEQADYGYKLDISVNYSRDGHEESGTFTITHAVVY